MSTAESDISWPVLRRIVQNWAGTSAELVEVRPLHGGCINTTLCLVCSDGRRAVIKISQHRVDHSHSREAYQLNLLRTAGLPVPQVYAWSLGTLDDPFSYALIEFMPGITLAEAKKRCTADEFEQIQQHLAELIAHMHTRTADGYMRVMENGAANFSWPGFYRDIYDVIWKEASRHEHLPKRIRKQIDRVHDRLDRLISHADRPRLLHWDMWSTNILCAPNGDGRWHISAVLDPNCKFAHAEAEIAYMELFHTVTPAFMKCYQHHFRLPSEYHQMRKTIYQLYPMINHLNLFGQEYLKPVVALAEKTTAWV